MGAEQSLQELHSAAEDAIAALAASDNPEAFRILLALTERVGVALGESARSVARATSWTAVGDASGTTKQAAWSRWH